MIEINNISFKYVSLRGLPFLKSDTARHGDNIFENFSMTLNEGCVYGLLGKNGTGTSTLLYIISGLLSPQHGTVKMDGVETRLRRPEMLREMFIVPEEFDLPPVSLDTYVKMNAPFYPNFSRDVLDTCLRDFELPLSMHLGKLSMGQKKKVYRSFALAAGTRLLLMDEPTNGLDIPSKSQFRRVVANCMTDSRTVVISTHQVHDVEQLLDHILMINRREVLLNASVADICSQYSFEIRQPGAADSDDVLYAEPSLQGNSVIARRNEASPETPLNLELLFNYVNRTDNNQEPE